MTSRHQRASDLPGADADRRTAEAGSNGPGATALGATDPGAAGSEAVVGSDTAGAADVAGRVPGEGLPGPVGWSSGAWGAGATAGRVRPQRRPAPSRRLSQVRAVPAQSDPSGGVPEEASVDAGGVPVDLVGVPMGVVIGGSPGLSEGAAPGGHAPDRRVSVRLLRFGSGTCQVVLPEWRSAIAVSVSTEQLQRSTGLSPEELRSAVLSVVINPEAVHDRELGLRDWQAEVPAARGRRRGRRQVR